MKLGSKSRLEPELSKKNSGIARHRSRVTARCLAPCPQTVLDIPHQVPGHRCCCSLPSRNSEASLEPTRTDKAVTGGRE
ncbi:hypothetical protein EVAR_28524_1 [Eumeta japonica]|uniref:Uncharacterized protein n=1 Tax=Eumeta variegata TaxID=151549 RepID=A0A4C1WPH5_EUMVA|nr:hypothetical protein EVAR_28524_1 [Eumeta japonica]